MAQIGSTITLEGGNLSQFDGSSTSGNSPVVEAVAGSAYNGSYGLHASFATSNPGVALGYKNFPWPSNNHLWIKDVIRVNSASGGWACLIRLLAQAAPATHIVMYTDHQPTEMALEMLDNDSSLEYAALTIPSAGFHTIKIHYDKSGANDIATLFIDNVQRAQISHPGHYATNPDRVEIGARGTYGDMSIDVSHDNIEIWDSDPDAVSVPLLVVSNLTQNQTLDTIALTQHNILVVSNITQTQTIQDVTLNSPPVLSVSNIVQNQTIQNVDLVQHNVLSVSDISQLSTLGNPTLSYHSANPITDLFFQHHSTGRDLINRGGVIDGFVALGYDFWDEDYNDYYAPGNSVRKNNVWQGIDYVVPSDNTDYPNWPTMWGQTVHDPPDNWLSHALTHQVIMLKACFPNSLIETAQELTDDENYIASVRAVADAYPNKLFIILTQPPLIPANSGGAASAQRARDLANWMVSSLSGGRANLKVFDFFDLLAVADGQANENTLKAAYQTGGGDDHPNTTADETIGPIFVDFVDDAVHVFENSAISLSVSDLVQAQTIQSISLTQHNVLSVSNIVQVSTIDPVVLTVHNTTVLSVSNIVQTVLLDSVILVPHYVLVVSDLVQTQELSNVVLVAHSDKILVVQDIVQNQVLNNIVLTQHNVLEVQNIYQGQSMSTISLDDVGSEFLILLQHWR